MNKYLQEAFNKFTPEEQKLIKKMAEEIAAESELEELIREVKKQNYWIKKGKELEAKNRQLDTSLKKISSWWYEDNCIACRLEAAGERLRDL